MPASVMRDTPVGGPRSYYVCVKKVHVCGGEERVRGVCMDICMYGMYVCALIAICVLSALLALQEFGTYV